MYLGFDIGGTSVKYGIIDENFNIIEKSNFETDRNSAENVLNKICSVILEFKDKYSFEYVGIGAPGFVDSENGIVKGSSNTPFKNTHVVKYIEEKTGVKTLIGNDANCAAYGEYVAGRKKSKNFVVITLGTGVGGGIVIEKNLYIGSVGFAGEIGHIVLHHNGIPCSCGKKGCFEQYSSATALIRMTKDKIKNGSSLLSKEMADKIDEVDGKTVFNYEETGCSDAIEVLDEYGSYLADGIESIYSLLQPDEIILAGGITNQKEQLMKYVSKHLVSDVKVSVATLASDAGLIGAAILGYKA